MAAEQVGVLRLHDAGEALFIDQPSSGRCLKIDKITGNLSESKLDGPAGSQAIDLYALVGIVDIGPSSFVIGIAEAEAVGEILGHRVMRALRFRVVPARGGRAGAAEASVRAYLDLLDSVLAQKSFYFSLTRDLTRNLQALACDPGAAAAYAPLVSRADTRFLWNAHAAAPVVAAGFETFATPLVFGFAAVSREVEPRGGSGAAVTVALISRRSRHRAGRRFTVRGVDERGHVANFVETEQIVVVRPRGGGAASAANAAGQPVAFSHVQIRGSIPVHWAQPVDLKYAPTIVVDENPGRSAVAARAHFDDLIRRYGDQAVVSLVNLKGKELAMARAFENLMGHLSEPRAPFFPFDFHKECSKMRYERLGILIDRIAPHLERHGYLRLDLAPGAATADGARVARSQSGTVRCNCMDCLDRTNVFQSVVARRTLALQLKEAGVSGSADPAALDAAVAAEFKILWAENGDAVSGQYSGTGALKADFTRTGKRTLMGYVEDGKKSLQRYYLNNFRDGANQDAVDLFLGIAQARIPIGGKGNDPFEMRRRSKSSLTAALVALLCLLLALLGSIFAIPGGIIAPEGDLDAIDPSVRGLRTISWIAFWSLCVFIAFRAIQKNGRSLVDIPRFGVLPRGSSAYN